MDEEFKLLHEKKLSPSPHVLKEYRDQIETAEQKVSSVPRQRELVHCVHSYMAVYIKIFGNILTKTTHDQIGLLAPINMRNFNIFFSLSTFVCDVDTHACCNLNDNYAQMGESQKNCDGGFLHMKQLSNFGQC